jgi:hypothetical protein
MKNILEYLDRMGLKYTLDTNPSPEKIEKIKKLIAAREEKMQHIRDGFASGDFEGFMNEKTDSDDTKRV